MADRAHPIRDRIFTNDSHQDRAAVAVILRSGRSLRMGGAGREDYMRERDLPYLIVQRYALRLPGH